MEPLTPEQWEELFTSCKQSASHLEMRDWYDAEDEKARFERFLATGHRDHAAEAAERREWLDLMRKVTSAGVRVRRARIASEPASDYIRFEWHGAGPTVEGRRGIAVAATAARLRSRPARQRLLAIR